SERGRFEIRFDSLGRRGGRDKEPPALIRRRPVACGVFGRRGCSPKIVVVMPETHHRAGGTAPDAQYAFHPQSVVRLARAVRPAGLLLSLLSWGKSVLSPRRRTLDAPRSGGNTPAHVYAAHNSPPLAPPPLITETAPGIFA